jgi:hypothetical protein
MAFTGVQTLVNPTTKTGNTITFYGTTNTYSGASTCVATIVTAVDVDVDAVGDIHGFLRFPFADEETLEGALTPVDLKTAQIRLTNGGADAVLALLAEEVFGY